jgi:hypothetical protein
MRLNPPFLIFVLHPALLAPLFDTFAKAEFPENLNF